MVFDNVYPSGLVLESLEKQCACKVAVVPFMDCAPNTEYIVSYDGAHVFVSVDFGGYCQVKEIPIIPAGKRSANSKPAFKRRKRNGYQTYAALPTAVYGAFVLFEMPRYKLRHIDGDPNNCHADNLAISGSSDVVKNLELLRMAYEQKYKDVCNILMSFRQMPIEKAQDYASNAFVYMCMKRQVAKVGNPRGLWVFLAKEQIMTNEARNRIDYGAYHAFLNVRVDGEADENAIYASTMEILPKNCQKAASLLLAGYTQREISQKMACSQSWVNRLLKKSKSILENYGKQ